MNRNATFQVGVHSSNPSQGWVAPNGVFNWDSGSTHTISAGPYSGYEFDHWVNLWSGGSATYYNSSITVTVDRNETWTAVFRAIPQPTYYHISVSASTGGSATGSGDYEEGSTATIRATANHGYEFDYWEDDRGYRYSPNPYSFTVDRARTFVAHFATLPVYHISATSAGGGTVSGGGDYYEGDTVVLSSSPASGYDFDYWEDDQGYTYSTRQVTFTANRNRTFVCHFKQIVTYNVLVTTTRGGTVSGGGTYPEGSPVNVYAYPDTDFDFDHWVDDRGYTYSTNPYVIDSLDRDRSFVAYFTSKISYLVTTSGDVGCHTTGGGRFTAYTYCTVRATLDPGYVFDGWYIGETLKSTQLNYFFSVGRNTTLYAKCHWEGVFYPRKSAYLSGDFDEYFLNYDWFNYSYPNHPFTYPIPNCTTYAYARTMEICIQLGVLNWYTLVGNNNPVWFTGQCTFPNATDWFYQTMHNGWTKGNAEFGTPQIGAIVCFAQGSASDPGHVAVIEETDGTLAGTWLSYSGYRGQPFYYKNMIDVINEYHRYGMEFVGYLYNPFIGQQPGPTPGTQYTITLYASPSQGGNVFGAGSFDALTVRYIHATPNTGWRFVKWSDDNREINREIYLNADITLTAYFREIRPLNPGILAFIIKKKRGVQNVQIKN